MKFRDKSSFSQCDICQELKAQCLNTSDSFFALYYLFPFNLLAFETNQALLFKDHFLEPIFGNLQ